MKHGDQHCKRSWQGHEGAKMGNGFSWHGRHLRWLGLPTSVRKSRYTDDNKNSAFFLLQRRIGPSTASINYSILLFRLLPNLIYYEYITGWLRRMESQE